MNVNELSRSRAEPLRHSRSNTIRLWGSASEIKDLNLDEAVTRHHEDPSHIPF